jgi:hypothetical protein
MEPPMSDEIDINKIKISVIGATDVAAQLIREITIAFVREDDYSIEALARYHAAITEHTATLQAAQSTLAKDH